MRKLLNAASIALMAGMIFCSSNSITALNTVYAAKAEPQIKIGEKFAVPDVNLKNKVWEDIKVENYVLNYKEADVTGDKVNDKVILVGARENEKSIWSYEVTAVVQDGKTKKYSSISTGDWGGYGKEFFLGDFNNDKISDVMVTLDNGGSGGTINTSIFSFVDNKPATVMAVQGIGEGLTFEGKFADGFKAEVLNKELNKKFTIDLTAGKTDYINDGVYDENGKVLKETTIAADGFGILEPVDWNGDGTYELRGIQAIWGTCHVDTLSHVETVLKYENSKWNVMRMEYSSFILK